MKVAVLIPAFNAAKSLVELITGIKKNLPKAAIIVVNDGSHDQTAKIAEEAGAVVLSHVQNRGKGETLKTGFGFAVQEGFDLVLTMDADLQHLPAELPRFIENKASYDLILGTRRFGFGNMPFDRVLTNFTTSVILTLLSGETIRDSQSGYRLISGQVLRQVELKCRRYDLESEILIKAGRKGFKIGAVPISTVYAGSRSFINPLVDTGRFVRICWKSLFW